MAPATKEVLRTMSSMEMATTSGLIVAPIMENGKMGK